MLLAITVFAIVSRLVRAPYPIVMLVGGALIALIPGLQPVLLAPDVVFLVLRDPPSEFASFNRALDLAGHEAERMALDAVR